MYIFIILCFIFGCMSLKTHTGKKQTKTYFSKTIDHRYKRGADNFVYLVKTKSEISCKENDVNPKCVPYLVSSASGLVLSFDDASVFILTAAHFCEYDDKIMPGGEENIIGFAKDQERELTVLAVSKKDDACIMMGPKYENESFNQIKLARKDPILGADVYTVAAPNGIGGPGFRPIFVGKFAGCDELGCMTTLPGTFGSSGAGIYNSRGELITIVMAVSEGFESLILSPSRKSLHNFILTNDKLIDIYYYED